MNTSGELQDYSGDFKPDLSYQDFCKETLVGLLELYGRLYEAVDGFWYLAVKNRMSNEETVACDKWVLEKMARYELKRLTRLLNIQGNDVATLMKSYQVSPWFCNLEYRINLKNRNHAILTVTSCSLLEALEKEGGGRIGTICGVLEPIIYKEFANFFNTNIEVRPLKLPPPRQGGICCQWEYCLRLPS